ncbi:hypothetical protein DVH05_026574 [Phytophthora capsici]|nr:hypothetical protein DVH05_026574 [Phytophthora capsici]
MALEVLACLHEVVISGGLTQESLEELAMYKIKGRNASNFRELKRFLSASALKLVS